MVSDAKCKTSVIRGPRREKLNSKKGAEETWGRLLVQAITLLPSTAKHFILPTVILQSKEIHCIIRGIEKGISRGIALHLGSPQELQAVLERWATDLGVQQASSDSVLRRSLPVADSSPEALICTMCSSGFILAFFFQALGILLGRRFLCVTIRLLLLAGSQREILEAANVFLPVLPCNITAKPRATRESKIPITRKKTASFAFKELRWQSANMSVVLCVQQKSCLGEYPNLWQAEWPNSGLLRQTYSVSPSCEKTRPQRLPPRTSMEHYFTIFPPPRLESARHSSARLASSNTRSA